MKLLFVLPMIVLLSGVSLAQSTAPAPAVPAKSSPAVAVAPSVTVAPSGHGDGPGGNSAAAVHSAASVASASDGGRLTEDQKRELRKYDFAGALHRLKEDEVAVPPLRVTSAPAGQDSSSVSHPSVPKDWQAPHAELGPTATSASLVSTSWSEAYNLPLPGRDGRVLFSYGGGMPVLVCAPLRICVIELQAGEHINGQAHLGDTVRWEVSPVLEGTGLDAKPLIVAKPVQAGLDTDLVVPTDRRTYVIRLVSDPTNYVARIAFTYPADEQAKWAAYQARQDAEKRDAELQKAAEEAKDKKAAVVHMDDDAIDKVYFEYKLSGDKQLLPERVLDDGQHTYIVLRDDNRFRELPTLMVYAKDKTELVNFRVENNRYIVDRLFNKAILIVGVGKQQQKVTIARKQPF